jgi:urease accessory protein
MIREVNMSTSRSSNQSTIAVAAAAISLLLASPALAHTGGSTGGFVSGLSHPIGGWDHILAMVAVGLWGAQLGRPLVWLLPIAFPLMMACGAAMGLMGYPLPGVEVGIACSAIALGLMVLLEAKLPAALALAMVAFFAVFHGHAHGTELPAGQSGLLYSIGFVISTGLLHGVGIGIGTVHHWKAGKLFLRGAGACVLAGGVFFLCSSFGWIS